MCHSCESGNPEPGTRGQVWMPAFAGMTPTFLSHSPILTTRATSSTFPGLLLSARISTYRLPPATYSDRREISLKQKGSQCFACEATIFACETILFSSATAQAIEIVGWKLPISRFGAISRFTTHLFRAFSPSVFRADLGPSLNLVSQNSSIARILFQRKQKRRLDSRSVLNSAFTNTSHATGAPEMPRSWPFSQVAATPKQTSRCRAGSTALGDSGRSLSSSRQLNRLEK